MRRNTGVGAMHSDRGHLLETAEGGISWDIERKQHWQSERHSLPGDHTGTAGGRTKVRLGCGN
jgi:hypothetical protein